ncbi:uncharacterized protein LOC143269270 isoform X1 [Peromyscus maniculatus bairdii]|uniref:uncharacterized protein LOC143269270 isoform X1 n=1 Tax=Peromyscus maniculatus bairdii TaxID=230844 RepID=UPI003FD578D5
MFREAPQLDRTMSKKANSKSFTRRDSTQRLGVLPYPEEPGERGLLRTEPLDTARSAADHGHDGVADAANPAVCVEENMILLEKDEKELAVMCCEERLQDGCQRCSTSCCSSRKTRSRMPSWMPRSTTTGSSQLKYTRLWAKSLLATSLTSHTASQGCCYTLTMP